MKQFDLQAHVDSVYAQYPAAERRPVIGITANYDDSSCKLAQGYYQSVIAAGGIPVVIPPSSDRHVLMNTLDHLDGLLLSGGADINPLWCGEEPVSGLHGINRERDLPELLITRLAYNRQLPILGICRGIQTLNVFLGGSLWQDLPSQYPSALKHGGGAYHRLVPEKDSFFSKWTGEDLSANSYHHQAIKELAPGLIPDAHTEDGVIEAVRFRGHPNAFAVQFHPEKNAPESALSRALFARLADEAKKAYRS